MKKKERIKFKSVNRVAQKNILTEKEKLEIKKIESTIKKLKIKIDKLSEYILSEDFNNEDKKMQLVIPQEKEILMKYVEILNRKLDLLYGD